MTSADTATVVTVLKHLIAGRDFDYVKTVTGLTKMSISLMADANGFPNKQKMQAQVDRLMHHARSQPAAVEPPAEPKQRAATVEELLTFAAASRYKSTRNAAETILVKLDALRSRCEAEADENKQRARVALLEEELRAAKAAIGTDRTPKQLQRGEFPCFEGDCNGRTFTTVQGRAVHAHKTHKKEAAA